MLCAVVCIRACKVRARRPALGVTHWWSMPQPWSRKMAVAPYGGTEPRINKQNIIMMMMWWSSLTEISPWTTWKSYYQKNHMIICAIERGIEFNVKHTTHRPQYWLRLKSHDNLYISCSAVGFLRARLAGVMCKEPLKPVDFPLHLPRPSANLALSSDCSLTDGADFHLLCKIIHIKT